MPLPSSLQGPRCYIDASTQPDQVSVAFRDAGLRIFIIHTQVQPPHSIFIKVVMNLIFVIMADVVVMALAAEVITTLHMQQVSILSDNQQLVHFINGPDLTHPPN
jgi:hypothetical protein